MRPVSADSAGRVTVVDVTATDPALGDARSARWSGRLRTPRRVLMITGPLLAVVLAGLALHTGGQHIDLEVYRSGVQAWLAGRDLYGPLPETSAHIALPFIYPPFAAILMIPWALMPWTAAWVSLFLLSTAALGTTLYVVARRLWPSGGSGGALSVASIALPLTLVVQPGPPFEVNGIQAPSLGLEPVLQTFEFKQINLLLINLITIDCL